MPCLGQPSASVIFLGFGIAAPAPARAKARTGPHGPIGAAHVGLANAKAWPSARRIARDQPHTVCVVAR